MGTQEQKTLMPIIRKMLNIGTIIGRSLVHHHHSLLSALVFWSFLDSCKDILMGTHKEGGASTFWSYILNLPLSSNSMISWKFCYLLHKVLRDGHRNVGLNISTSSIFSRTSVVLFSFTLVMCNLCFCLTCRRSEILTDTVATLKIWEFSG